jgi:integrase
MGRGVAVVIKHVHRFKDRHGKVRHYLRLPNCPAVSLPGASGSPEFMAAYNAAIAAHAPQMASLSRAKPGSMRDLAERYYTTAKFKAKAERTRYVERNTMERFMAKYGEKPAASVQTRHLDAILSGMVETPAAAMDLRKRLRHLFKLAIKLGWRSDDPVTATDTFKAGTHHTWTEEEIAQFHAKWQRGTMRRTAFDLLLFTGQRSGDVRRMTWNDVRDGRFRVAAQEKTGQPVAARIHRDLIETLAAADRSQLVIISTAFGKPFSQAGFGNWIADAIERAGLPERCVAHGLRKASARRLAEAGCTPHQIKAITGHKSLKEVQRYTEAADREGLADGAMDRWEEHG